jgi:DNA modification methylase
VDIGLLGFTSDEVERVLALVGVGADADDEGFDPTPPADPTSRPGDVYLLGPHRLVCGDARDAATWDALVAALGTHTADAIWTDPPYGVDLQVHPGETERPQGPGRTIQALAGDTADEVGPLLAQVWPQASAHLTAGGAIYVAGPSDEMGATFVRAFVGASWHLAQTLVWVKNGFVPGRADYHHQHELVYYGWTAGAAHQWLGAFDKSTVHDEEPDLQRMKRDELITLVQAMRNLRATDVVRVDKTRHNLLHPTMKPTALIRHMLANSTRRGDVVLDPFAGSGSTMVACELLGRRAALIELEPRFCDVIVRRWRSSRQGTGRSWSVADGYPKSGNPPWRPSDLTPELSDQVANLVRAGNNPMRAALARGVPRSTFYYWTARGRAAASRRKDGPGALLRTDPSLRRGTENASRAVNIAREPRMGPSRTTPQLRPRTTPRRGPGMAPRRR